MPDESDSTRESREPEPIWTKSKWKHADLDGQLVEFVIPIKDRRQAEGLGHFLVRTKPDGQQYVQIRVNMQGENPAKRILHDYQLTQAVVDRIALHPDQTVARYQVKA